MENYLGYRQPSLLLMVVLATLGVIPAARADQQLIYSVRSHSVRTAKSEIERQAESNKPAGERDKPIIQDKEYTQIITLGKNSVLSEHEGQKIIFDFPNKRCFQLAVQEGRYAQVDLHAPMYFRIMEYKNRQVLGKSLKEAGADSMNLDNTFNVQNLLAIDDPDGGDKLKVEEKTSEHTTHFFYGGYERASCTPSEFSVEPLFKQSFARAMAQLFTLHPSIRTAILTMNIPKELRYSYVDFALTESFVYQLKECKIVPSSVPVPPANYTPLNLGELQPVMDAFATLGTSPKPPEKDKVRDTFKMLAGRNKRMDAFLALEEYFLTTGEQMEEEFGKITSDLKDDPDYRKFVFDLYSEQNPEDIRRALQSLESIKRTSLTNAHIIDIMRAHDYEALDDSGKARELLISVLKRHPTITGAYHDLGTNYMKAFQMEQAWYCFNMADKIVPHFDMMEDIHKLNSEMEARFPEFF